MSSIREVHEQLLDILIEFDRVCRKNDLKYTLAWGTMLGAVRHGGFIPWDGDVDVLMMRDEYEKYCRVCKTDLKKDYFFQTKESEPAYRYNVGRLRKNNTAMIYRTWKNAGFHQGIYIDIQPLDHIPDSNLKRYIQDFFIILNTPVRMSQNPVLFKENGEQFNKVLKGSLYWFSKVMPKKLCEKIEYHFITKYNHVPCKKIGVICEGGVILHTTRDMLPFDAVHMEEYADISFEGHSFMCVKDTDALLKLWYGNYMELPPEEKRHMDHDPIVFDAHRDYKEYLKEIG